jgi:hypothetical protein
MSYRCLSWIIVNYCVFAYVDISLDDLLDSQLEAICGLHRSTFLRIYRKYCMGSIAIPTHLHLLRIFAYLKLYPTSRSTSAFLNTHLPSIKKGIMYLASVINELTAVWNFRNNMINRTNHRFSNNVIGSIDTFPIVIYRPTKNQSLLYNGKYNIYTR